MARSGSGRGLPADPTEEFFDRLRREGYQALLRGAAGCVRVELVGSRPVTYVLTVQHGHISVARRGGRPDAVVRLDHDLFDRFVAGRANVTTALLRGEVAIEGDLGIVASVARLFPGPPASQRSFLRRQEEQETREAG